MTRPRSASRAALAAFLVAFALLLLGTWTHALWDADEPRFAESTREMFVRGDFVVPWLNGEPRYDKPILVYWLQAAGYLLFGLGEAGARFPSVLGLAVAAAFTARIGARVFEPRAGLLAGLVLPTCVLGAIIGRAATADGILLGAVVLTIDAIHARARGARSWWTWLQLWGGVALCFLAKGPPGWVAPLSAGLAAAWLARGRVGGRRLLGTGAGILLALALIAAWAVPALVRTDGEFLSRGLGHHVVERASRGFEGHGGYEPWWLLFYPAAIFLFLFPWSAWLPQVWRTWRAGLERREDRILLGGWIAGTLLVFTISVSKMPHYVLPLYPAIAVLLGGFCSRRLAAGRSLFEGGAGAFSLVFLTAAGAAAAVGVPALLALAGFEVIWVSGLSVTFLLAGWIVALWVIRRRPAPDLQWGLTAVAITGALLLVLLWILPEVSRERLTPKAGRALARSTPAGAARYWVDLRPDSLVFYSQEGLSRTTPIRRARRGKEVVAILASEAPAAVVLTEEREREILEHQGLERLPGRLFWRKRAYYARRARWETVSIHVSAGTPE